MKYNGVINTLFIYLLLFTTVFKMSIMKRKNNDGI